MSNSGIKGEIVAVTNSDFTDRRVILVNNNDTYALYVVDDQSFTPYLMKDSYDDGTPLTNIESIFSTGMKIYGYWEECLGIIYKNNNYAVKFIKTNGEWKVLDE